MERLNLGMIFRSMAALCGALFAVVWLAQSQPAFADAIVQNSDTVFLDPTVGDNQIAIGDTFGINFLCADDGTCVNGEDPPVTWSPEATLEAMAVWTVTAVSADSITFDIVFMNTTNDPNSTTNRITGFGVVVLDPAASGATIDSAVNDTSGTATWTADINETFPGGFKKIDLTAFEDPGGGADGIFEGETTTFSLTLDFDTLTTDLQSSGLLLQIFPVKFQGVGGSGQSIEFAGTLKTPPDDPTEPLPQPASLLLFGFGLLGVGGVLRWQRRRRHDEVAAA